MLVIDFKRYIAPEVAMLISAGIGAASTAINAGVNSSINEQNRRSQAQANEAAYRQQRQLLALQQGYNSPMQQVLRLRAAGLNPALVYGNGSASTGNVDSVPQSAPVGVSYDRPLDFAGGMSDSIRLALSARQQLNENELSTSRIALESAEGFELVTRAGLNQRETEKILQDMGFDTIRLPYEIAKYEQELSESKSRELLNYAKIKVSEAEIDQIAAQAGLTRAQTERIVSLLPAELANMNADTALKWCQTDVGRRQIAVVEAQLRLDEKNSDRDFNWKRHSFYTELDYKVHRDEAERQANIGNNIVRIATAVTATAGVVGAKAIGTSGARTVVKGFGR